MVVIRIIITMVVLAILSLAVGKTNAQLGWIMLGVGLFLLGLVANKLD